MIDWNRCSMWRLPERTTTCSIVQVQYTPIMILNCHDRSNRVSIMTKTKWGNYMTNRTDVIYAENETKLPWPIELGPFNDKKQTGQRRDWSYRSALCWNQNSTVLTYMTECSLWCKPDKTPMWPIVQVRSTQKTKLSCYDARTECHLWRKQNRTTTWLIVQVRFKHKTIINFRDRLHQVPTVTNSKYDNYVTDHIDVVYFENKIELSRSIESSSVCDEN